MFDNNERVVAGFPLAVLWSREGKDLSSRRLRDMVRDEADKLIMDRSADIVIAQVGGPLLWLRKGDPPSFWKRTDESAYYHTATSLGEILDRSTKPNYIFYPSEWEPTSDSPLVLLESIVWPYHPQLKMF